MEERQVPILTSFGDRRVVAAVNSVLVGMARAAHCAQPPDDHSLDARVAFVGEDLLSVKASESWMCGAPYPTTGSDSSVTFDLRTGQPVGLEALLKPNVGERADRILYAYHWAQAAAATPPPPPAKGGEDEFDCLDLFREGSGFQRGPTRFHFSPEGLVVQQELVHAIAACADEVTVPYAALADVAAPGSALARLAAADTRRPLRYRIRTPAGEEILYSPPR